MIVRLCRLLLSSCTRVYFKICATDGYKATKSLAIYLSCY